MFNGFLSSQRKVFAQYTNQTLLHSYLSKHKLEYQQQLQQQHDLELRKYYKKTKLLQHQATKVSIKMVWMVM
jgi:hypothetical protein